MTCSTSQVVNRDGEALPIHDCSWIPASRPWSSRVRLLAKQALARVKPASPKTPILLVAPREATEGDAELTRFLTFDGRRVAGVRSGSAAYVPALREAEQLLAGEPEVIVLAADSLLSQREVVAWYAARYSAFTRNPLPPSEGAARAAGPSPDRCALSRAPAARRTTTTISRPTAAGRASWLELPAPALAHESARARMLLLLRQHNAQALDALDALGAYALSALAARSRSSSPARSPPRRSSWTRCLLAELASEDFSDDAHGALVTALEPKVARPSAEAWEQALAALPRAAEPVRLRAGELHTTASRRSPQRCRATWRRRSRSARR